MKFLHIGLTTLDRITGFLASLAACLIIFVMLAIGVDVVMRYFFGSPMLWVQEVAEYSLVYMTFLGTAWLLGKEGHVKMDVLLNQLGPRIQLIFNVITSFVGAIICAILTWFGTELVWEFFQKGSYEATILEPKSYYLYVVIPLGTFLLFFQFLRRAFRYLEPSIKKETRRE